MSDAEKPQPTAEVAEAVKKLRILSGVCEHVWNEVSDAPIEAQSFVDFLHAQKVRIDEVIKIIEAAQQSAGVERIELSKLKSQAYQAVQYWENDSQLEVLSENLELALEKFLEGLAQKYANKPVLIVKE